MALNLKYVKSDVDLDQLLAQFDLNGDGVLEEYEMGNLCQACGLPRSYARLNQLLGKTYDGSEVFKFKKFIKYLEDAQNDYPDFLRKLFKSLDNDKNKCLTYDEIGNLCAILGISIPLDQLFMIMAKYDTNNSRALEMEEFVRFFIDLQNCLV